MWLLQEDEEELLVTKRDHAVIIDASSFTFIDSMGISALASVGASSF